MVATEVASDDTGSYRKAMVLWDCHNWREFIEEEIRTFEHKGVWSLVDFPAGNEAILTRWVHDVKTKANRLLNTIGIH